MMEPVYTEESDGKAKPAHLRVRDELLSWILEGRLGPGDKLPAEPEIARQLGVARMTANKAILSLVADGWLSRSLGRGTFVTVRSSEIQSCLIVFTPDNLAAVVENHYYGTIYWNIVSKMSQRDIRCIPISACDLPSALDRNTALIAVNPSSSIRASLEALGCSGSRVVVLGSQWPGIRLSFVDSDNVLGGMLAVNHLADLGHREFAFWGSYPNDSNTQDRIRGFSAALKARGLPAEPWRVLLSEGMEPGPELEYGLVKLLQQGVTAVVAGGAHPAVHAMMAALAKGFDSPEGFSIVAYDDPVILNVIRPKVTTISQPLEEMAAWACQMLLSGQIPSAKPEIRIMDPSLVLRESTARPRK